MKRLIKPLLNILLASFALLSLPLKASVHFTLAGKIKDSNYGLLTQEENEASLSVAFDVGSYLRLGVTHRQETNTSKGFVESEEGYAISTVTTKELADSIDLTIILYYGKIFVPYLQFGMIERHYTFISGTQEPRTKRVPWQPNGGYGLAIRLNENFSLKLSQMFSDGVRIPYPNAEPESTLDAYTSVGISYNL